jgi:DNA-binding MarR family transcriptional regulator
MPNSDDTHVTSQDDKQPLMVSIMDLLSQLSDRFEPGDQEMKQWMAEHFPNPVLTDLLQETTLMMLRVLDAVGQLEPVNGITISKQFQIPKGSVSKSTRRLIAKKLIVQESLPNNKKEVLFRLTPLGQELFHAHRAFDQQMEKGFIQFMQRYEAHELSFIVRVLRDALGASFLNPDAPPLSKGQSGDEAL